jgi:hypothetical protein
MEKQDPRRMAGRGSFQFDGMRLKAIMSPALQQKPARAN